jgi:hypothetical protein
MYEVAGTLRAQHLPPDLALATVSVLQHWADHTDQRTDLGSILRQLHVALSDPLSFSTPNPVQPADIEGWTEAPARH